MERYCAIRVVNELATLDITLPRCHLQCVERQVGAHVVRSPYLRLASAKVGRSHRWIQSGAIGAVSTVTRGTTLWVPKHSVSKCDSRDAAARPLAPRLHREG